VNCLLIENIIDDHEIIMMTNIIDDHHIQNVHNDHNVTVNNGVCSVTVAWLLCNDAVLLMISNQL